MTSDPFQMTADPVPVQGLPAQREISPLQAAYLHCLTPLSVPHMPTSRIWSCLTGNCITHSLAEYAALCASSSIPALEDECRTLRLCFGLNSSDVDSPTIRDARARYEQAFLSLVALQNK